MCKSIAFARNKIQLKQLAYLDNALEAATSFDEEQQYSRSMVIEPKEERRGCCGDIMCTYMVLGMAYSLNVRDDSATK